MFNKCINCLRSATLTYHISWQNSTKKTIGFGSTSCSKESNNIQVERGKHISEMQLGQEKEQDLARENIKDTFLWRIAKNYSTMKTMEESSRYK